MALTVAKMTRTFDFLGVRLPDPNPSMSVDDVKAFSSNVIIVAFDPFVAESVAWIDREDKPRPTSERFGHLRCDVGISNDVCHGLTSR